MAKWLPIIGHESFYEISDDGDVRRKSGFWCKKDRLLKKHISNAGYARVKITHLNGSGKWKTIHRMVYAMFVGEITTGMTINHKNGNKLDNRLINLEAMTRSEQMIHAYKIGLQRRAKGEARINVAKLTNTDVHEIRSRFNRTKCPTRTLAAEFNVTIGCIQSIISRRRWNHI